MPSTPPSSAATPARAFTVPSPPHATTPRPWPKARSREGEEIVGIGGEHQLDVEVGGGERVEHPRESGPRPARFRPGPAAGVDSIAVQRSGAGCVGRGAGERCHSVGCAGVRRHVDPTRYPGTWRSSAVGIDDSSLADVVDGALAIGLRWLTVEVRAERAVGRPARGLASCVRRRRAPAPARRDELHGRGVRVRGLGRRDERVPQRLQRSSPTTEAMTVTQPRDDAHAGGRPRRPGRADRRRWPRVGDEVRDGQRRRVVDRRGRARRAPVPRPTCPTPTSSSAPAARTAPPTSWCGSRRTPSWCSPTCRWPAFRPRRPLRRGRRVPAPRAPLRRRRTPRPPNISKFTLACAREP